MLASSPPLLPPLSSPPLFAFPARVVYLALCCLVFLLLVHSALSLCSFLLAFLFFNLTSAPATGHPNAVEHALHRLAALLPSRPSRLPRPSAQPPLLVSSVRPPPSISLRWSVSGYCVHVHHWLYLLLLYAASLLLLPRVPSTTLPMPRAAVADLVAGWCAGGLCQGLKYDDWHLVLWREEPGNARHP